MHLVEVTERNGINNVYSNTRTLKHHGADAIDVTCTGQNNKITVYELR